MSRNTQKYDIWDTITPVAVTSSTDATPIVITATSHGLETGDSVSIYGHTTNVAANGIFKVTKVNANSFQLQDRYTGANVAGSGAGAGSGGVMIKSPKIIFAESYRLVEFHVITSGTATLTILIAGSQGVMRGDEPTGHGDTPNFGATNSKDNPYTFLQIIDLSTGTAINGSTGIAASGADINKQYEVNTNGMRYISPIVSAWTQGAITFRAVLSNDD